MAIHGSSMDGRFTYFPLSEYLWMPQVLCPSVHGPSTDGQVAYPPLSDR